MIVSFTIFTYSIPYFVKEGLTSYLSYELIMFYEILSLLFPQNNTTLKVLRLNGNKIGNPGGMAFAQALQINTTLKSLDIGDADLVS